MKEIIKNTIEIIFGFILDNIYTIVGIIFSYLIYRLISYYFKKLNIKEYSYEGYDELLNKAHIVWFSETDTSGNNNIFRFKDKNSKILIFINKQDITFKDKIKMIWFFSKKENKYKKMLPKFLVKKYILPQLTQIRENNKQK